MKFTIEVAECGVDDRTATECRPPINYGKCGICGRDPYVRLTIEHTGEIREALTIDTILKSLAKDFGYYLRKV